MSVKPTLVNRCQHALAEHVDRVALLDEGHERRDATLVVGPGAERLENLALEGVAFVEQLKEIVDGLVSRNEAVLASESHHRACHRLHSPFIRVLDPPQARVVLIIERRRKIRVKPVVIQLSEQEHGV